MSAFLAWSLLTRHLECRICWSGHVANVVLALSLAAKALEINP